MVREKNYDVTAFDQVIGYQAIKTQLLQIVDMIHDRDRYLRLGAKMPHGVLLYGEPGLGKTMMAQAFIASSDLRSFPVRKDVGGDSFVEKINDTFHEAADNAPSIIFLDDMDKFASEDNGFRDADEFVAVQAGFELVKDRQVLVVATANDVDKIMNSLLRAGRFDCKIEVEAPVGDDAEAVLRYYMKDKPIDESVDFSDIARMMDGCSCADLESIINEAAISAAYEGLDVIGTDHIVNTVLHRFYERQDGNYQVDDETRQILAIHEAGHAVMAEAICKGCVGLASINTSNPAAGGFVHIHDYNESRREVVMISLAGKVATELYYGNHVARGCFNDLRRARMALINGMKHSGSAGYIHLHDDSDIGSSYLQSAVAAELEHYTHLVRGVLLDNRPLLEGIRDQLIARETLLSSDIRKLEETTGLTGCVAA